MFLNRTFSDRFRQSPRRQIDIHRLVIADFKRLMENPDGMTCPGRLIKLFPRGQVTVAVRIGNQSVGGTPILNQRD